MLYRCTQVKHLIFYVLFYNNYCYRPCMFLFFQLQQTSFCLTRSASLRSFAAATATFLESQKTGSGLQSAPPRHHRRYTAHKQSRVVYCIDSVGSETRNRSCDCFRSALTDCFVIIFSGVLGAVEWCFDWTVGVAMSVFKDNSWVSELLKVTWCKCCTPALCDMLK